MPGGPLLPTPGDCDDSRNACTAGLTMLIVLFPVYLLPIFRQWETQIQPTGEMTG
jgi:hypothetical protein